MSVKESDPGKSKSCLKDVDEKDFLENEELQRIAYGAWLRSLMEDEGNCPSPIDIDPKRTEPLALPPLEWFNHMSKPRLMKATNTGNTIIVSAKWETERPYLLGGPFRGSYVFSQMHFHWGPSDDEGSEHSLMGESFPLELHVAYFKTAYKNQETALKMHDGTAILVYFYRLDENDNDELRPVFRALPHITEPRTSKDLPLLPLSDLGVENFAQDYFFYYGSVNVEDETFPVMWFIWPNPIRISSSQVDLFRNVYSTSGQLLDYNFRPPLPAEFGKNVFFVYGGPIIPEKKEDLLKTSDNKPGRNSKNSYRSLDSNKSKSKKHFLGHLNSVSKTSGRDSDLKESEKEQGENAQEENGCKQNNIKSKKIKDENAEKHHEYKDEANINKKTREANKKYGGLKQKTGRNGEITEEIFEKEKEYKIKAEMREEIGGRKDEDHKKTDKKRKPRGKNWEENEEHKQMNGDKSSIRDRCAEEAKAHKEKNDKIDKTRDENGKNVKESKRKTEKSAGMGDKNAKKGKKYERKKIQEEISQNIDRVEEMRDHDYEKENESTQNGGRSDKKGEVNPVEDKDHKLNKDENAKNGEESVEKDEECTEKAEKNKKTREKDIEEDAKDTKTPHKDESRKAKKKSEKKKSWMSLAKLRCLMPEDDRDSSLASDSNLTEAVSDKTPQTNESQMFNTSSSRMESLQPINGTPTTVDNKLHKADTADATDIGDGRIKSAKTTDESKNEIVVQKQSDSDSSNAVDKNSSEPENTQEKDSRFPDEGQRKDTPSSSEESDNNLRKVVPYRVTDYEESKKSLQKTQRSDDRESVEEAAERRSLDGYVSEAAPTESPDMKKSSECSRESEDQKVSDENSSEENLEEKKSNRRINKPVTFFVNTQEVENGTPTPSDDIEIPESVNRTIAERAVEELQDKSSTTPRATTTRKPTKRSKRSDSGSKNPSDYTAPKDSCLDLVLLHSGTEVIYPENLSNSLPAASTPKETAWGPETIRTTISKRGSIVLERVENTGDNKPSSFVSQKTGEVKPRIRRDQHKFKDALDSSKSVPSMPKESTRRVPTPEELHLSLESIHDRDKWSRVRKLNRITNSTYSCFVGSNAPSVASLPAKTSRYQLESYLPDEMAQSPINIDSAEVTPKKLIPLEWFSYNHSSGDSIMSNANGLVEITMHPEVKNLPCIKGGPLSGEYLFSHLVFLPWSEHTVDNQRFSIEAQIYFFKQDYGSLISAIIEKDGLIAIGFFFEANSEDENRNVSKLLSEIHHIQEPRSSTIVDSIDLMNCIEDLVKKSKYFTYGGSLTVPPFTACTWIIFPDPIDIPKHQVEQFRKLPVSEDLPRRANRPIQPLHKRDIILAK